jgi:murein DD-endopeptidase MepM/ murein hydrolase activator NlpD
MIKKSFYISISLIITLMLLVTTVSKANTVDELQAKIDTANKNKAALEKEITAYQNQLKTISEQSNTLQNTIKTLDVSTSKITTQVKLAETNISATADTIEGTGLQINSKQEQIDNGNLIIKQGLKQTNEADNQSIWEILLSNDSLSDFWGKIENTIQVEAKISAQVASVKDIKVGLEKAKADLEQKKKELENYTKELNNQKQVLQSTKKEKTNLLTVTKNTEANYQKILKDKLALKDALDKEISDSESKLKLYFDPKSLPKANNSALSWPLDKVFITQLFGKTSVSGRLYASGSHNGIDFRAPIGTKVLSAGDGVVEGVGDTDPICPGASYGKWVFIRYDNGLASAYGHLSLIASKAGQRVKAGDVVAYSGATGYSTGPHLHMSVFAGQGVKITTLKSVVCRGTYTIPLADPKAYLDPMVYLPTY